MLCAVCESANQAELSAEMLIHFTGLQNINNSGVMMFPKLLICLDCGFARFAVPETELDSLRSGLATARLA